VSRLLLKIIPVIGLLCAFRAHAATVVVVRPASASPGSTEVMSRLRGELLSLGVDVVIAERHVAGAPGPMDPRAWLEGDASGRAPDAVLDVVGDVAPTAVDSWILEKKSGRAEVSRAALERTADADPGQLAIRAVEVLRSSLLEIDLAARTRGAPAVASAPAAVAHQETRTSASLDAPRFSLEAGAAVLAGLDGVGPALVPIVRAGWAARSWFALQATLAGLGSRPEIATSTASARLAQQYGTVGACVYGSPAHALAPYLALAAGALRTAIDGQADPPGSGHFVERWSFVLDGSVGGRLRLPGRYQLALAAHVQIAEPYVAIYFMNDRVATTGRPNLLVSLTVGAWL
jgi:hypothetical protein